MDADYNVDEAVSWSTRPEREEQAYNRFRADMDRAADRSQRQAEIAREKEQ